MSRHASFQRKFSGGDGRQVVPKTVGFPQRRYCRVVRRRRSGVVRNPLKRCVSSTRGRPRRERQTSPVRRGEGRESFETASSSVAVNSFQSFASWMTFRGQHRSCFQVVFIFKLVDLPSVRDKVIKRVRKSGRRDEPLSWIFDQCNMPPTCPSFSTSPGSFDLHLTRTDP
jgi:hypothetical protein